MTSKQRHRPWGSGPPDPRGRLSGSHAGRSCLSQTCRRGRPLSDPQHQPGQVTRDSGPLPLPLFLPHTLFLALQGGGCVGGSPEGRELGVGPRDGSGPCLVRPVWGGEQGLAAALSAPLTGMLELGRGHGPGGGPWAAVLGRQHSDLAAQLCAGSRAGHPRGWAWIRWPCP